MDIARVDQLRRHLRENPKYHKQASFACETTACAAGWVIALEHGAQVGAFLEDIVINNAYLALTQDMRQEWSFHLVSENTPVYARMLLGLSENEAYAIFYKTLNADDPEGDTVALLDALIHREKGELTEADAHILWVYGLSLISDNEE